MAKPYLEELEALLRPVTGKLPPEIEVEVRHFFSGAAAYANGRICITLTAVGLALKLPLDSRSKLIKAGARPLRYFANGPVKKDYAVVPATFRQDRRKLALWTRRSIDHALTLPKPRKRSLKSGRPQP
jgi:TfoX/Sxy family transcriptional regulator of competence genes